MFKPYILLVPGRGNAFLDLYLNEKKSDLVELSEALLDVGEASCLVRLNNHVANLPGKELKKLVKLIEEHPAVPGSFQQAVEQALAAQPQETGIKGMFQKMLGRSNKE